jgi:stage III sporulation protein AH
LGLEQADKAVESVDDEVLYVTDTLPYEVQKVSGDSSGDGYVQVLQSEAEGLSNEQNAADSASSAVASADSDYVPTGEADSSDKTGEGGAKYSINSESDYFINYRLEREKARSRQLELLQELIDDEKTTSEVRSDAQAKVIAQAEAIEQELMLESIMVAKYGGEAAVFIQPEKVNVVLEMNPEKMSDSEAAKIAELVNNYTGIGYENVIVVLKD